LNTFLHKSSVGHCICSIFQSQRFQALQNSRIHLRLVNALQRYSRVLGVRLSSCRGLDPEDRSTRVHAILALRIFSQTTLQTVDANRCHRVESTSPLLLHLLLLGSPSEIQEFALSNSSFPPIDWWLSCNKLVTHSNANTNTHIQTDTHTSRLAPPMQCETHQHMHTHTHKHTQTQRLAPQMLRATGTHTHTHTHTPQKHTQTHEYTQTHTHTHLHIHTHTNTHIHTHSHTQMAKTCYVIYVHTYIYIYI